MSVLWRLAQCRCRALETPAHVPNPILIAALKHPGVASRRIGEDLPRVVVGVIEVKAVRAVLHSRLGDLLQLPDFRVTHYEAMALVHPLLGLNIDTVVIEEGHFALALWRDLHDDVDVLATQAAPQRNLAGLDDFESKEL